MDLGNQAIEKMLIEMENNKSPVTERLHVWLCNQEDEELLKAILKEDRSLTGATEYCYAQGSKIAIKGVADVSAEMEQEWCRKYYLKDKITKSDLKVMPPSKGEKVEVVKEVVKHVEKVVYKTPTADEIAEYLDQQKRKKSKKVSDIQESLF